MNFKSRLQRLERRFQQQGTKYLDLATIAVVDEHGKVVKALVRAQWLTGDAAAEAVAETEKRRAPLKIFCGFDPQDL